MTHDHRRCHRRQTRTETTDFIASVDVVTSIPIAVDDEQHLGLHLPEAVEHGSNPELRRT